MSKDWELILIRHGKTPSNERHAYLGKTEEDLSETGKAELLRRMQEGYYPEVNLVLTSPMKRCIQTAELLYPNAPVIQIPEWTEMDFGDFEGMNYKELSGRADYQKWVAGNGTQAFPNGEDRAGFTRRNMLGFKRACDVLVGVSKEFRTQDTKRAAAIVHGGTIMALLSNCCGSDYFDYQVENGNGYCCKLFLTNKRLEIKNKL